MKPTKEFDLFGVRSCAHLTMEFLEERKQVFDMLAQMNGDDYAPINQNENKTK